MQAEQPSERERFEAWDSVQYEIDAEVYRHKHGERYVDRAVQCRWECWQARAALSNPSPQWLPIESAPKDATNVLLRDRGGHHADGYWLRSAYNGNGAWIWPFIHANPTHWMPLPPPPEQGSKG